MSTLKLQILIFSSILSLSGVLKAQEVVEEPTSKTESDWVHPYAAGVLVNFADGFLARQAVAGSMLLLLNAKNRVCGESAFAAPSTALRAGLVALHLINLLGSLERLAVPELGLDIDRWNPQRLLFGLLPEVFRKGASNLVETSFAEYSNNDNFKRGKQDSALAVETLNMIVSAMALYQNVPKLLPSKSVKSPLHPYSTEFKKPASSVVREATTPLWGRTPEVDEPPITPLCSSRESSPEPEAAAGSPEPPALPDPTGAELGV